MNYFYLTSSTKVVPLSPVYNLIKFNMEMIEVAKIKDEEKVIPILFEAIKAQLGEEHSKDILEEVLKTSTLLNLYIEKYKELKEAKKIRLPEDPKDTPCGLPDTQAIFYLHERCGKRATAARILDPSVYDKFPDKDVVRTDNKTMEAIAKYFGEKEDGALKNSVQFEYMGPENCPKLSPEMVEALAKSPVELFGPMCKSKLFCYLSSQSVWVLNSNATVQDIEALNADANNFSKLKNLSHPDIRTLLKLGHENIKYLGIEKAAFVAERLGNDYLKLIQGELVDLDFEAIKIIVSAYGGTQNKRMLGIFKALGVKRLAQMPSAFAVIITTHLSSEKIEIIGADNIPKIYPRLFAHIGDLSIEGVQHLKDDIIKTTTKETYNLLYNRLIDAQGTPWMQKPKIKDDDLRPFDMGFKTE
jgi:hypothetical protein